VVPSSPGTSDGRSKATDLASPKLYQGARARMLPAPRLIRQAYRKQAQGKEFYQ